MRLIFNLLRALLIVALLAALSVVGLVLLWQDDLRKVDDLNVLEYGGKATVMDARGGLIGTLTPTLGSGGNHGLLKAGQISPWLGKAVVSSEDRRFYSHHGIDPRGLARALLSSARGDVQGGSTITQQVVRSTILSDIKDEKTPTRKAKEALLALQVERHFSKAEILTAYLNVVYWGVGRGDLLGAGDAARAYFGTDASRLTLAQSVYLATLLPNPRRYLDYPAYRPLMGSVLKRMVEDGRATQAQAQAAWREPIQPSGWRVRYDPHGELLSARLADPGAKRAASPAPQARFADSFLDAVERDLAARLGRGVLYRSDVTVYTTMSRSAQQSAEDASRGARLPAGATLGLALLDPASGDVRALVGQKLGDGVKEGWNNATRARRQVGSSVKPLLYALALSKGWSEADTVPDAPLEGDYQPKNYSGRFSGRPVTLRYALDHSLNLPTVRLAQQLGLDAFVSKLRELGLSPAPDTGLPLAIGALEASPLELAAAYAPFANGGVYHAPRLITRVVASGKTLLTLPPSEGRRVWDEQTAWLGLDLLRGVVNDLTPRQGGLGWKARIEGREVGGKTGTTNDVRDLWFAGVTPGLSGAVWVGRSDNAPLPRSAYSGDVAAPVWQAAASGALRGQPLAGFSPPDGVEVRRVGGLAMAFRSGGNSSQGGPLREAAAEPTPVQAPVSQPPVSQPPVATPAAQTQPDPQPTDQGGAASAPAVQADPVKADTVQSEPLPAPAPSSNPTEPGQPQPDPARPDAGSAGSPPADAARPSAEPVPTPQSAPASPSPSASEGVSTSPAPSAPTVPVSPTPAAPDAGNSDASRPDAGNPNVGNPNVGNPNLGNPDASSPGTDAPALGDPVPSSPEPSPADGATPGDTSGSVAVPADLQPLPGSAPADSASPGDGSSSNSGSSGP